jgi:hypothetical protein
LTGTTRKKPLCRKRSMWNDAPRREVFLASLGGAFRSRIFPKGEGWNEREKKLNELPPPSPRSGTNCHAF